MQHMLLHGASEQMRCALDLLSGALMLCSSAKFGENVADRNK